MLHLVQKCISKGFFPGPQFQSFFHSFPAESFKRQTCSRSHSGTRIPPESSVFPSACHCLPFPHAHPTTPSVVARKEPLVCVRVQVWSTHFTNAWPMSSNTHLSGTKLFRSHTKTEHSQNGTTQEDKKKSNLKVTKSRHLCSHDFIQKVPSKGFSSESVYPKFINNYMKFSCLDSISSM